MANIPVEPTRTGIPWWVWLLGLLGILLLVLLLSQCGDDDVDTVVVDQTEAVMPPAATLDLSDVYVTRVVGDKTFFVAPTAGGTNETLVYLNEDATPGTPTEGRYDVTEGQHLSINGQMMPVGDTDLSAWGLTPDQTRMVGDQYVRASSLTVLDRPDGAMMDDGAMDDGAMDDGAAGAASTGPITTLAALNEAMTGTGTGRTVRLSDVRVASLAGDSTFYVGTGAERVLVVLEDLGESQSGPGTGADGAFNVDAGDTVSLTGEVMAFRPKMRGTSALPDADRTEAERRRHVVVVNSRGSFSKR